MTTVVNAREVVKALRASRAAVGKAEYRAVNYAARRARTEGGKEIRAQVNLKASYVNQNLRVSSRASAKRPEAVISARRRATRLARYGARQLTRRASRAWGDPLRGIEPGQAQAGVSVKVKRAARRKKMRKAFFLPLRAGKEGGYILDDKTGIVMGVFVRTGPGRKQIKHLYGPSVDQVFRDVREQLRPGIRRDLVSELKRQLALQRARAAT